ncbi:uncharacterized protein LOC129743279 [Uranotaenia lowii]|uniref:uncharacterized protein LOC129743279 n=1 Tax=Uranotaenia lowii TaxID=190385 RepID=UPI002479D1A4|nr:uncharacterized protein LOC129743279 [Uranotaenia lowii]
MKTVFQLLLLILSLVATLLGVTAQEFNPEVWCRSESYRFFADPTDCGRFVFCNEGIVEQFECPASEIWSQEDGGCIRGYRDSCTPWDFREACNEIEGDGVVADLRDCSRFISCVEGEAELMNCARGYIFSEERMECILGSVLGCESLESICDGNSDHEKMFVHPEICSAFIGCENGNATVEFCPEGEIFREDTQYCVRGNADSCLVYPAENVCTEIQNGTVAHPEVCTNYVECFNGTMTVNSCPRGTVFKPLTLACTVGNSETCLSLVSECESVPDSVWLMHPNHCDLFVNCNDGSASLGVCSPGKIFRPEQQFCVPGDSISCEFTPLERMCDDSQIGAIFPNPENCYSYVRCELVNGKFNSTINSCPDNHIIQPNTLNCILGIPETCQPLTEVCQDRNDQRIPVASDCSSYILCQHENAVTLACPPGEIFDPEGLICIPGYSNEESCRALSCEDITSGLSNHPDFCHIFYRCDGRDITTHMCPLGHIFNGRFEICAPGDLESCEFDPLGTMCTGRLSGVRFPYPDEDICTDYVVCDNQEADRQQCPPDTVLQPQTLECVPGLVDTCERFNVTCDPNLEQVFPHPTRCDLKIICVAGSISVESCPEGQILDPETLSCVTGEVLSCLCAGQPDGIIQHPSICKTYIQCSSGEGIVNSCNEGEVFSAELMRCLPGNMETCQVKPVDRWCEGMPNDIQYPHPDRCVSFVTCQNELVVEDICDRGLIVSPNSDRTVSCIVGNSDTCQRLDDQCLEQTDGIVIEHPNHCDLFLSCDTQQTNLQMCEPNLIFDPELLQCAFGDSENCIGTCADEDDGTIIPHPDENICEQFLRCQNELAMVDLCPLGTIFSGSSRTCTAGNSETCEDYSSRCSDLPDSVISFPQSELCELFLSCSDSETTVRTCPEGTIFREEAQMCVAREADTCEVSSDLGSFCEELEDGEYAHPNVCFLFVECSGGIQTIQSCPPGTVFEGTDCVDGNRDECP